MKNLQKLILPLLVGLFVFITYVFYFEPKPELGKFSSFDPNNTASREIKVKLLKEKGIDKTGMEAVYWVIDGENKEMMITGPSPDELPEGFYEAEIIILFGHLSPNGFHAHGVRLN